MNQLDCSFSGGAGVKTKEQSYTEALEERLAAMQNLLDQYSYRSKSPEPDPIPPRVGARFAAMSIRFARSNEPHSDTEQDVIEADVPKPFPLLSSTAEFIGESSVEPIVGKAAELRDEYLRSQQPELTLSHRTEGWRFRRRAAPSMRELRRRAHVFPPPSLLAKLVDEYFAHVNVYIPLLHRPTFERLISGSEHFMNRKFAETVLLTCAVGARYCSNPEVLDHTEGDEDEGTEAFERRRQLSAGWKYFSQVPLRIEGFYESPGLFDLQRYCLAIQFLEGWELESTWALIGIAIRIAHCTGAHRKQPFLSPKVHTIEAELWRRAFWTITYYDRTVSCALGRPPGLLSDEFDIQPPTVVDDAYWDANFEQPVGTYSQVAFFNSMLKLTQMIIWTLRFLVMFSPYRRRTIVYLVQYTLQKKVALYEAGSARWKEDLVLELDSALNEWADTIPEHLRWDPTRLCSGNSNLVFFKQSAILYAAYYHVRILIHRPFITSTKAHLLPSFTICTSAARSCVGIAKMWMEQLCSDRVASEAPVFLLPALATAGVVLLLGTWQIKSKPAATDARNVQSCMDAIRACELRWRTAGMHWDILNELLENKSREWSGPPASSINANMMIMELSAVPLGLMASEWTGYLEESR
uniref:Xylanolytic transcriptional activator regulatory domain-containing protein n=1 Tax=Mycena chlorophos TaxID=658473 RepID=A0ABQ0LTD0_MYCCL|nr:predicted protein [Mycena chlorophos]